MTVAWALEVTEARPHVTSDDGTFTLPLVRVGDCEVHAAVATLPWGTAMRWHCRHHSHKGVRGAAVAVGSSGLAQYPLVPSAHSLP